MCTSVDCPSLPLIGTVYKGRHPEFGLFNPPPLCHHGRVQGGGGGGGGEPMQAVASPFLKFEPMIFLKIALYSSTKEIISFQRLNNFEFFLNFLNIGK